MPQGRAVELAGDHPQQIDQHQTHRTADRGISPVAIGQDVVGGVHAQGGSNGSVDHDKLRATAGAGGAAMHIKRLLHHGPQHGHHHRHTLGTASGHDRVHRHLFGRQGLLPHLLNPDDIAWRQPRRIEAGRHPIHRRRYDRQPVRPALILIIFIDLKCIVKLVGRRL